MKRKALSILLATAMAAGSLAGCGGSDSQAAAQTLRAAVQEQKIREKQCPAEKKEK